MKPYSCMTVKQKEKIDWICETLGIEYTGSPSGIDAWNFIQEHVVDADRVSEQNFLIQSFYSQF